jgi:hypothetical protein
VTHIIHPSPLTSLTRYSFSPYRTLSGLIALHVRHGYFLGHCVRPALRVRKVLTSLLSKKIFNRVYVQMDQR